MKSKILLLIAILALSDICFADIEINQVLYDPIGTESGGESIVLYNNGPSASLEGYRIATSATENDVVFDNITLKPNSYFVVADAGWDEKKDEDSYPSADLLEPITMKNSDSGIALYRDDVLVDAVGWGDNPIYYEGTPSSEVPSGKALLRVNHTGDNSIDFIESIPFAKNSPQDNNTNLQIYLNILDTSLDYNISIVEDEDQKEGIQIYPSPGTVKQITLTVVAEPGMNITAHFADHTYQLNYTEIYQTKIPIDYTLPPGNYDIDLSIQRGDVRTTDKIFFEYMPLLALNIDTPSLNLGNISTAKQVTAWGDQSTETLDRPTIQNLGNIELDIGVSGTDLVSDSGVINITHLFYTFDNSFDSDISSSLFYIDEVVDVNLGSGQRLPLALRATIPEDAQPGLYEGTVFLTGVASR